MWLLYLIPQEAFLSSHDLFSAKILSELNYDKRQTHIWALIWPQDDVSPHLPQTFANYPRTGRGSECEALWCQPKPFLLVWKAFLSLYVCTDFNPNGSAIFIHQYTKSLEGSLVSVRVSVKSRLPAITAKFLSLDRWELCNLFQRMSHCVRWF